MGNKMILSRLEQGGGWKSIQKFESLLNVQEQDICCQGLDADIYSILLRKIRDYDKTFVTLISKKLAAGEPKKFQTCKLEQCYLQIDGKNLGFQIEEFYAYAYLNVTRRQANFK